MALDFGIGTFFQKQAGTEERKMLPLYAPTYVLLPGVPLELNFFLNETVSSK